MANVLDILSGLSPGSLIGSLGGKIIETVAGFFPNPEKKAEAAQAIAMAQLQGAFKEEEDAVQLLMKQADINLQEAKSEKWWVAGWRPYIGWTCGTAFGYAFVIQPFAQFVAVVIFKSAFDPKLLPILDMSTIIPVLMGMLGLAGMRSFEKVKGANGAKTGG